MVMLTSTASNNSVFTFNKACADAQFCNPDGAAVDSSGNVFVADTENSRIQKFRNTGTFIKKWGSSGSGNGKFSGPFGVAVDSSGNVLADSGNSRIQKFTNDGKFIRKWGSGCSASIDALSANPTNLELNQLNPFALNMEK
jgi:DNA-binding beta-propeller fold protein YncE